MPTRHTRLQVRVWDERHTGANDSLAECTLQLATLYDNVQARPHEVHEVPRQLYKCTHPLYRGQQAKIDLSISMMTRDVAEQLEHLAGFGRGQPNQAPFLPPPRRRPKHLGQGRRLLLRRRQDDVALVQHAHLGQRRRQGRARRVGRCPNQSCERAPACRRHQCQCERRACCECRAHTFNAGDALQSKGAFGGLLASSKAHIEPSGGASPAARISTSAR